ncbi:MAG TPA: NAD(P)/FAD-dependent oxidoreductase [Candidatus Acidoferrales bacterium]|jgi:phytoene dehydrogenase-like protein|nr:NAD(P)/FAD-dependent oxidoreductase [Candidatus Acidoferrales bacterium]
MSEITRRGFIKGAAALTPLAFSPLRLPQEPAAGDRFDFVVAGAGHNSLVCAAYLSKAGYKVLVLEGRPTVGGGTKTQEVCLPGFKEDLCSSVHSGISGNPLVRNNELNLRDYGYGEYIESDPVMHIPFIDGNYVTVWHDIDRTCETISRFSKKDAQTFRTMVAEFKAHTAATAAAREAGTGNTKIPKAGVWQRRFAMSGYDLVCEMFESDYMRRSSLCCGHFGSVSGGAQNTGGQAYSLVVQQINGRPVPKGGSGTLAVALARFIEAHNGVVQTNKPVTELLIEGQKCAGVRCADGSTFRAEKAVISTIHIKHLVDMAPRELWGDDFLDGVELFQPEHAMISLHYATSEPPQYPLAGGGTISTCEAAISPNLSKYLLLDYENAMGDLDLDNPPGLQIVSPSVVDPSRAPAGYHTVKIESNLPYQLKEGPEHWDKIKDQVADSLLNHLRKFAPNLTPDKVLAKFIESPLDIERMNPSMWRGSAHGGANDFAQSGAMRPVPGWAQYRMPIAGLYQTGSCTAPGGSVTGMPGRNAASVILKDNGTSLEEVVRKA